MTNVKNMTTPAARLSCDEENCKNKFQTQTGLEKHMKNKHEHLLPGTSKQTVSHVLPTASQADDEVIPDDGEDEDLLAELQRIEDNLKEDSNEHKELLETVTRLRVVLQKKTDIQKGCKKSHEDEMKKRSEVEENQKKDLDQYKNEINQLKKESKSLRERNISILRESKKKKALSKDLGKEKSELNNELTILRVKNGILTKDNSDLKIKLDNKSKYINELQESLGVDAPVGDTEPEVTIVVENQSIRMNKESSGYNCNACDRSFGNNRDLDNHMEAKHSQKVCDFCEEVVENESELKKHINQCEEYNKTTVKCNKCQKIFTRFGIKTHGGKCHAQQTKDVYACAECGHKGKSANEIKNHQAKEHTDNVYACDECGLRGKSAKEIRNHQAKNHKEEMSQISKEVCKHWRRGNCLKGNRCLYSHVGYQQSNPSTSTSKTNTSNWSPACRHGEDCSWLAKGSCRFFHKGTGVQKPVQFKQQNQSKDSRLCKFNERCTNTMCRFKHTLAKGFHSQRLQEGPTIRIVSNGRHSQ